MNRIIVLVLVIVMGMTSCNKTYDPPIFKNIENVQLSEVKDGKVNMKADAILYNPNDVKGKLKSVDIAVFIEGKKVATMKEDYSLKILATSDFSLPMSIGLDISELGLINSIFGLIQGKGFEVHYIGKAKVTIHGVPVNIPIDYHDVLKLR